MFGLEIIMGFRIYNTESELICALKSTSLHSQSIITIDGVDGVGKTTLSIKIAEVLCLSNIELDDFVQKNQDGYIKYIDYDRLLDRIISNKPVIIEGICIQQILNKIQVNSDVTVYVKVVDRYGFCNGQIKYFPPNKSADEVINERKVKGFHVGYEEDVILYHYSFKPHENSDYIFERRT